MRKDFAKQLTERERIRHADHYHNYRNIKGPTGMVDDEVGGRESMRKRFNFGYDRKEFNENLNPLKGWLRSCIGKKWDKCYSELRKNFDARSVVNAHILEHLYDFIQIHTKVVDGKVVALSRWARDGWIPVKQLPCDYYVCPKDGTVKVTSRQPRRSLEKVRAAKKLQEKLAVERYLDDRNVLRFIDGVWYHFELKEIPTVEFVWSKPLGASTFECGSYNKRMQKTWEELNQSERERYGQRHFGAGIVRDLFTNQTVYRDQHGKVNTSLRSQHQHFYLDAAAGFPTPGLYHATKQTASHKQLKQAGLVG